MYTPCGFNRLRGHNYKKTYYPEDLFCANIIGDVISVISHFNLVVCLFVFYTYVGVFLNYNNNNNNNNFARENLHGK